MGYSGRDNFRTCCYAFFQNNTFLYGYFQKDKLCPVRPFIGGIFFAAIILDNRCFINISDLGIPIIESAFKTNLNSYDFLLKLLFTSFTIGAGFKGGEVTPLFFIGAALGNALVWFVPLPLALLAGMGLAAHICRCKQYPHCINHFGNRAIRFRKYLFHRHCLCIFLPVLRRYRYLYFSN
jgi:hypothetical protein